jgi:hypothetical protein
MYHSALDNELPYSKNSKSVLNSLVNMTMNSAVNQSKPFKFTLESSKVATSHSNILDNKHNRMSSSGSQRGSISEIYNAIMSKNNLTDNRNRYEIK